MSIVRSRQWPAVWFLVAAGLCMVIGLLGALGPSLLWFFLAVVLDAVALVLFVKNRELS